MPEPLPSEAIQRAALAMARTLGPWVGSHAPEPGDPQSWVAQAQREDRLNGRPARRYSLHDPRFLLRLLIQEWRQFDHQVTPLHSSYARELMHCLNVCAHEPLTLTAADAERAVDTMRLLLESLGLAESKAPARPTAVEAADEPEEAPGAPGPGTPRPPAVNVPDPMDESGAAHEGPPRTGTTCRRAPARRPWPPARSPSRSCSGRR